ncbi:MAG TPA: ABC transporter permease [Ktedonobacterales bacterium]|jgi:ABC-2 type transport system permease protein
MTSLSLTLRDTATMLRRDLRHSVRRISMSLSQIGTPVIMLLLFDYFYGGALGAGVGGVAGGGAYINYLAPGILVMSIGSGCATTAINLCMDMSEGIIARFRTMAIARTSVLTGQVIGSLIRTLIGVVLVAGIAVLMGFRPSTGPVQWLAALGVIALLAFGVTWMGVAFGLVGKTPAGANSLSLIFLLLAFTSSAFVRADSMPAGIRWFAEYQPFTASIDVLRGLLLGTPVSGGTALLAVAWCVALALAGYLWARGVYARAATAAA